jgi:hypothetical protein
VLFFTFIRKKICLKTLNKIKPPSPIENGVDTYGPTVFAPDYSATVLASKMCTNSHVYYISMVCPQQPNQNILINGLVILHIGGFWCKFLSIFHCFFAEKLSFKLVD